MLTLLQIDNNVVVFHFWIIHRKVASSSLSWIVALARIFRLLMKGNFDARVLWPLAKRAQNCIVDPVDQSTTWNFTVLKIWTEQYFFFNSIIVIRPVSTFMVYLGACFTFPPTALATLHSHVGLLGEHHH